MHTQDFIQESNRILHRNMSSRYQRNRVHELAIKWRKVLCFLSMNFESGWNMQETQFGKDNNTRKLVNINRITH